MSAAKTPGHDSAEGTLYGLLDHLDRLEALLEEMDELGVASRAEIEQRIRELNARIDELPDE